MRLDTVNFLVHAIRTSTPNAFRMTLATKLVKAVGKTSEPGQIYHKGSVWAKLHAPHCAVLTFAH
jgi:hypothetical protein